MFNPSAVVGQSEATAGFPLVVPFSGGAFWEADGQASVLWIAPGAPTPSNWNVAGTASVLWVPGFPVVANWNVAGIANVLWESLRSTVYGKFGGRVIWEPKLQSETRTYWFDATELGTAGAPLISVTATTYMGPDTNPQAIINGPATKAGNFILQSIQGGILGNLYNVVCTISTTDGQTLSQRAWLAIIPDVI